MKHIDNDIHSANIPEHSGRSVHIVADVLMWLLPAVLIVPNVWLSFSEYLYTVPERIANVAVPLGIYMLVCGVWKRIGVLSLCAVPLMIFCAFQIVLLYLYGESIIAVDMFLNLVTTNVSEATELLSNLITAILTVILLYLPVIVGAIWLLRRKGITTRGQRRPMLIASAGVLAGGVAMLITCFATSPDYEVGRKLFPINVFANIGTATQRTVATAEYFSTSADFSFDADGCACDSDAIVVLVIGETSRACNWQLAGYERPNNPRLSSRNGLTFFPLTLSESNITHKSVPLMMSHLEASAFGDSIYEIKGVIDAFKEAGFSTSWISNQKRNGALIDFFGSSADSVLFLTDDDCHHYDTEMCPILAETLASDSTDAQFLAIHTYGSHFNYRDRLPEGSGQWFPDENSAAKKSNRQELLNAYDNTILSTDLLIDSIASILEATGRPAALLYVADHGEDIFDDYRSRFLHASPTPTYYQIHVPMIVWTSTEYRRRHPDKAAAADANATYEVSSSRSTFHTLLHMAGIRSPYLNEHSALTSERYTPGDHYYLNDYNEAVPLPQSGLRPADMDALIAHGFTPNH